VKEVEQLDVGGNVNKQINMKKESSFKMKGFSGFGSPLKKDEKPRKGVLKGNMPRRIPTTIEKEIKANRGSKSVRARRGVLPNLPKKVGMGPLPGPRIPAVGGSKPMSDAAKAVNYLNKANLYKAAYNPKTAGPGSLERNPYKGRKFSKKARNVGVKKYSGKKLFSSFSKFFGKRATGIFGLMGGTPLGVSSTPRKSGSKPKVNFKSIGKDLQKAVYQGNKKRYK
jgi:hypothetical protein